MSKKPTFPIRIEGRTIIVTGKTSTKFRGEGETPLYLSPVDGKSVHDRYDPERKMRYAPFLSMVICPEDEKFNLIMAQHNKPFEIGEIASYKVKGSSVTISYLSVDKFGVAKTIDVRVEKLIRFDMPESMTETYSLLWNSDFARFLDYMKKSGIEKKESAPETTEDEAKTEAKAPVSDIAQETASAMTEPTEALSAEELMEVPV